MNGHSAGTPIPKNPNPEETNLTNEYMHQQINLSNIFQSTT